MTTPHKDMLVHSDGNRLSPNVLALIALSNEYCQAIEGASESQLEDFVNVMTRLLPRIYITVSDIPLEIESEDGEIMNSLDEETYETLQRALVTLLGEEDAYLEVFEEDMKYSDTPIAASISEDLCDIFQVLYDYIESVKDAPLEFVRVATMNIREDFGQYWSQKLCNVLRALNSIKYR